MSERGDTVRTILHNRHDVLRALVDGPTSKAALTADLSASRSTVDRAVRDLESIECVTRTDDGFVATPAGELALAEHDRYRDRLDGVLEAEPLVNSLPADAPLDPAILVGARISMPEEHAPDQAIKPSLDLLERATALHGIAPAVLSIYPDVIEPQVREEDIPVEIVAEPDVLAVLPNLASDRVEPLVAHETVTLYETAEDLPYALWIMGTADGDVAGITAYDDGGVAGMLMNDRPAAVEWAWAQFEAYRTAADEIASNAI